MKSKHSAFKNSAFLLLLYTLVVIVWGAWVRISKSGDGCGENWPLCQGQFIPSNAAVATWIEFLHRLTSGLYGLLVIGLFIWALRRLPRGHWARWTAGLTTIFMITEALLGARLVLAGLVGANDSAARASTMALHLVNSLMLTGSLALTWHWGGDSLFFRRRWTRPAAVQLGAIVFGFLVIGGTGAIAALSKTLFPSESLWQAAFVDFHPESHFLLRLRIWHPLAATLIAALVAWALIEIRVRASAEPDLVRQTTRLLWTLGIAVIFGYLTLLLLSPVWMKLTHLLLAHVLWIGLVTMMAMVFASSSPPVERGI